MEIVIDTREQKPILKGIRATLSAGDYSYLGAEKMACVEFKRPSDLWSTITSGHARFKREIERAKDYELFCVVCSETYGNFINKRFQGSAHSKLKGFVVAKILHTLQVKYNLPFYFCNGEVEAANFIRGTLKAHWSLTNS